MIATIFELLEDHRRFHTPYQVDNFIIGASYSTPYGRYRQALREIETRLFGLADEAFSAEDKCVEMDGLEGIELRRKKFQLWGRLAAIRDKAEELARFVKIAIHYKRIVGDLTPDKLKGYDVQLWVSHLLKECAIDLVTHGRVERGRIELIYALPKQHRDFIMSKALESDGAHRWAKNYLIEQHEETPHFEVTAEDTKKVIEAVYDYCSVKLIRGEEADTSSICETVENSSDR